jgi:DNA-binding GntR family transcriptional regulator
MRDCFLFDITCQFFEYKPVTKALLSLIFSHMNSQGVAKVTEIELADGLNLSVRTIRRHILILEKDGLIKRRRTGWGQISTIHLVYREGCYDQRAIMVSQEISR